MSSMIKSLRLSTLKDCLVASINIPRERDEKNTLPKVMPRAGRSIHLPKSPAKPKSRTEMLRYIRERVFIGFNIKI